VQIRAGGEGSSERPTGQDEEEEDEEEKEKARLRE
jgi:hypothetical protein